MQVTATILDTPLDVGQRAAALIADGIEKANAEDRPFVLGCPSGRSAQTTYAALADEVSRRRIDLRRVVIALMDEYVVRHSGGDEAVSPSLPHSCVGFGVRDILDPLNRAALPGHGIPATSLWSPDVADPAEYDSRLSAIGGIDVFLLATGASDGHIALNPRGSAKTSQTRIVALEESTRRDNLSTFPTFGSLDDVPRFGVTVGIDTIRSLSRSVIMLVIGSEKREAVTRIQAAVTYEPEWPSTIVTECHSPIFLIDQAASDLVEAAL